MRNEKMSKYEWVLFDIDETLLHFDDFRGLKQMFLTFGMEFTEDHYQEYKVVNKQLWTEYQKGEITLPQLQYLRFSPWALKVQKKPEDLSQAFFTSMADICLPIEGALPLIASLENKSRLGVISNGFKALQEKRLARIGLDTYFDVVVISEQVGKGKPDPDIFNYALGLMGNPNPDKVLMVGDNFDADIVGGFKAGFDTCWINHHKIEVAENIQPTYHVSSLIELHALLDSADISTIA